MIMPLMTTTFIKHKLQDKSLLRIGYVQNYLTLMMLRGKQGVQERNGFIKVTQSEEAGGAGFKPQPSVSLMQLLQVAFLCVLCAVSKPRRGRDCSGRATTISSAPPCNGTARPGAQQMSDDRTRKGRQLLQTRSAHGPTRHTSQQCW